MSAEEIPGRILASYETTSKMGGDMPGMVKDEPPFLAQSLLWDIAQKEYTGLLLPNKEYGVITVGPVTRPDGKTVTFIYLIENDITGF